MKNVIEMLEQRRLLAAVMEVNFVSGFGSVTPVEVPVPDGSTLRDPLNGTDFGTQMTFQTTHYFVVRNSGDETLDMFGNPRVSVIGDRNDFRVTRQPIEFVQPAGWTYFSIEFLPTSSGLRQATISIVSNDLAKTPYTFDVFGGTGNVLAVPDVYEPDGDGSIANQRWFDPKVTPLLARQVSTDGVWKVHSIHKSNDIDWSTFEITEESDVLIQTTVAKGDTRLYLFDSSGNQIAYNNDGGEGTASLIRMRLGEGTYYVRADEYGNNDVIPIYALSVITDPDCVQVNEQPIYLNRHFFTDPTTCAASRDFALVIYGTPGNDNITLDLFMGSIRVTLNDSQVYFPARDVDRVYIQSLGGDDTVYLGGGVPTATVYTAIGNDSITSDTANTVRAFAGEGHDTVFGGPGNDLLNGGGGNDIILAGGGNDKVQAAFGNDEVFGGPGNDTLLGQQNHDVVYGDSGNDLIVGDDPGKSYAGNDYLDGGSGNDTVNGGPGTDILIAGLGADNIQAIDGEVDEIFANDVIDVIQMDEEDVLTIE